MLTSEVIPVIIHLIIKPQLGYQKVTVMVINDQHSFFSMLICPSIPEIWLFKNLTLKIHGQGHVCSQRSMSHCWLSNQLIHFFFISHQLALPSLRYSEFLPWKSKVKMMTKVKTDGYTGGPDLKWYVGIFVSWQSDQFLAKILYMSTMM